MQPEADESEKRVVAWLRQEADKIRIWRGLLPWRWYAWHVCKGILLIAAAEIERGSARAD